MEGRMSFFSLNARGWRRVLVTSYNSIIAVGLTKKRVTELLSSFYALKTTSKHFFDLLDDEFFNNAIFGYSLKHLKAPHTRHRIRNIIKTGKYSDLIDYLNLCKKWKSDSLFIETYEKSLPIVAQYADSDFMSFYLDCHYFPKLKFSKQTIVTALRRANERNDDNDMLLMLLPTVLSFCPRYPTTDKPQKLAAVLMEGKKLHFDNEIGFDEKFMREPTVDLLFRLIDEKPASRQLTIPKGYLLNASKLGSSLKFKKHYSNFNIKNTRSDFCMIKFRHRNSSRQNEIHILKTKITEEGPDIYEYEGLKTDNLYQLILRTSLFDKIFGSYLHQFVAVTKEALKLPLEEQPWYFGNISDTQKFPVASEAPNTSVFFTYSRGGHIYLVWTNTPASQKNRSYIGLRETLVTDSIEAHLPPNEFILGVYNGQITTALAEHLACKYVMQGDFEKAKRHIVENNVNLATAFKSPNIINSYLDRYSVDKINNEMLVWLIENNAPLTVEQYSNLLMTNAIKKCQENALIALFRRVYCPYHYLFDVVKRGGSYELLKAAYSSHHREERRYSPSLGPFLNEIALHPTKFPAETHAKKVLVTLAWQFGNNDNYFKVLPRELLNQILEDVEEPEYFQLIDHIIELWGVEKVVGDVKQWQDTALVQFLPYFWKRWDSLFAEPKAAVVLLQKISQTGNIALEKYGPTLRSWFAKILTSNKLTDKFNIIDASRLSPLTYYCLTTPNEEALSMLKLLLQHQTTTKRRLLQPIQTKIFNLCYPATWLAVDMGYLPTIKFLLDEDLLPETINGVELNPKKMSDLYARNSSRRHVKQFMEQYYADKKKIITKVI